MSCLGRLLSLMALWPAVVSAQSEIEPGASVAFLGLTFIDTSLEGAYFGENPDEAARIDLLEDEVRARFTQEGLTLADIDPVADDLGDIANPADCNGCDVKLGQRLGADYVLVGEVQKVSNLILAMNLVMRDVDSGATVRALAVDIRSNTDDSWLRGVHYILDHAIFAE